MFRLLPTVLIHRLLAVTGDFMHHNTCSAVGQNCYPVRKNAGSRIDIESTSIDVEPRNLVDFVDQIRGISRQFHSSTENRRAAFLTELMINYRLSQYCVNDNVYLHRHRDKFYAR